MTHSPAPATLPSAARGEGGFPTPRPLVWDAPVRVFHWLTVLCFAVAWMTAETERWGLVHVTAGYTMAGLLAFRIAWGLLGTRHARFASFVRGPAAAARYLGSLLRGRPEHHAGHNPAGGLAIVGLLALAAGVAGSGWAMDAGVAGEWLEDVHEGAATAMLALVGLHVAAVVVGSWLHGENLAAAMVSGRKRAAARDGIRSAWRSVAALLVAAVLGFWWLQWQEAPAGGIFASRVGESRHAADHDDD